MLSRFSSLIFACIISLVFISAIPVTHFIYRREILKNKQGNYAPMEVELFQPKKEKERKSKVIKKIKLRKLSRSKRSSRSRFQMDLSVSGPSDAAVIAKKNLKVEAYEMGQTDTPPFLKRQIRPAMPIRAIEEEVQGTVIVRFLVNETGKISYPRIIKEEPTGYGFGYKAIEAVTQYAFEPAKMKGIPVKIWVTQEIEFLLEE